LVKIGLQTGFATVLADSEAQAAGGGLAEISGQGCEKSVVDTTIGCGTEAAADHICKMVIYACIWPLSVVDAKFRFNVRKDVSRHVIHVGCVSAL
jgi:hypothetical protein